MELLSIEDISKLNQGIQQIYTLHDLDTFGVDSLAIVDRLVPSEFPMFHLSDFPSFKIEHILLPGFSLPLELDRVIYQNFGNHPIVHNMPLTFTGAYKISDFINQQELHCFEGLYQQFLRVLGVEEQMVFFLTNTNPLSWRGLFQTDIKPIGFALLRVRCSFTERDRSILNLLRPHLSQAYANAQKFHQIQQQLSQLQQSVDRLGIIILDRDCQVQSIAPPAKTWLETYFGKTPYSRQLPDHLRSWVEYQITYLNQNAELPNACLPLRIQQAGRELTIRLVIEPTADRYLLLLEERTLSALNTLALLGLSQRETEVLALVIQGNDNQAISSQLSINISTIRKHLEHIYTKLGVKSRTAAIAQALAKLGIF